MVREPYTRPSGRTAPCGPNSCKAAATRPSRPASTADALTTTTSGRVELSAERCRRFMLAALPTSEPCDNDHGGRDGWSPAVKTAIGRPRVHHHPCRPSRDRPPPSRVPGSCLFRSAAGASPRSITRPIPTSGVSLPRHMPAVPCVDPCSSPGTPVGAAGVARRARGAHPSGRATSPNPRQAAAMSASVAAIGTFSARDHEPEEPLGRTHLERHGGSS